MFVLAGCDAEILHSFPTRRSSDLEDGLQDDFGHYAMGVTAETLAQKFHISRKQQDQYALQSQKRAAKASQAGNFDQEILKISPLSYDEPIRPHTDLQTLGKLPPVYQKQGSVTAGNSSPLSDGASALLLMKAETAQAAGMLPLEIGRASCRERV